MSDDEMEAQMEYWKGKAEAAEAELAEALYQQKVQRTFGEEQWALREAAEAELAIEREHNPSRVICPKCQANLPCESCKRYSVQRDELEARAEAAEADHD
jgi:hypothetical protein